MRLFSDDGHWQRVRDADPRVFALFTRHYTFRKWRKRTGPNGRRMAGPGETIVLLSVDGKAAFIWKKQRFSQDGQIGINCALFRNEGPVRSSELILAAEAIARARWPGERLFTYVNARKVKSANPGYCFKMAGWTLCGKSRAKKLLIFEKLT